MHACVQTRWQVANCLIGTRYLLPDSTPLGSRGVSRTWFLLSQSRYTTPGLKRNILRPQTSGHHEKHHTPFRPQPSHKDMQKHKSSELKTRPRSAFGFARFPFYRVFLRLYVARRRAITFLPDRRRKKAQDQGQEVGILKL